MYWFWYIWILYQKDVFNGQDEPTSKSDRTESVDLDANAESTTSDFLKVEISDALNEKDKVKFTVKTKVFLNFHSIQSN